MNEDLKRIKEELKFALTDFCNYRINVENSCEEHDCHDCPMQLAYDMVVEYKENEEND